MNTQGPIATFESAYNKDEKEILILTRDRSGGSGKAQGETLWTAYARFLAYVDVNTNELKEGDGRIVWPLTEEEEKDQASWLYRFKQGCVYRLKVRELIDKTVPAGRLPSFYNRFLVVETLEENVHNDALLAILTEYRTPVTMTDETLGEFELNKDLKMFNGTINWLGTKISVSLDVDPDNKASWTKAMNVLRALFEQQAQRDAECRAFAAEHLVELANDWAQEEDGVVTKQDFMKRISLSELAVTSGGGDFSAYYDDDNLFLGHAVAVYGNIKKGLKSANIGG
jgi:hypothetical protein